MENNCKNKKQFTKPNIQVIRNECYDVLLASPASENAFGIDLGNGFFGEVE